MNIKYQNIPTQWTSQIKFLQGILLPRLAAGQPVDAETATAFSTLARGDQPLRTERLQAALDNLISNGAGHTFQSPPIFRSPQEAERPRITTDGNVVVDASWHSVYSLSSSDRGSSNARTIEMHINSEEDAEAVGDILLDENISPAQMKEALRVICEEGLCHEDRDVVCLAAEIVSYSEDESFYTPELVDALAKALNTLVAEDPTELPDYFNIGIGAVMSFGNKEVVEKMIGSLKQFALSFQGEKVIDDLLMEVMEIIAEQMDSNKDKDGLVALTFDAIEEIGKRDGDVNVIIDSLRIGLGNIAGPSRLKAMEILTEIILERTSTAEEDEDPLDNFIKLFGTIIAAFGSAGAVAHLAVESYSRLIRQYPEKKQLVRITLEKTRFECKRRKAGPILTEALKTEPIA